MRSKCTDCGVKLSAENRCQAYLNVCMECWHTRILIVNGKIVPRDSDQFAKIQRKMASGRGTAKRYIDWIRGGKGE